MAETKHISVLLHETVDAMNLKEGDIAVDVTLGGGGHSEEILKRIGATGRLVALDADGDACERARERFRGESRVNIVHRNFSQLSEALAECGIAMGTVAGIMADLGFSSDQIESGERGLSFQLAGPLDMRLDPREELTAALIANEWEEREIIDILRRYGDERFAPRIARAIVSERKTRSLETTEELVRLITGSVPGFAKRPGSVHPATRTFQALRIAVNREFERLEAFLPQAVVSLGSGGRLAVISFHSGEDRIVKRFIRDNAGGCICPKEFPVCICGKVPLLRRVTKKPITPSDTEREENPRARSAKLRVAERI